MHLRDATPNDLDFIVAQEARPEFAAFIFNWGHARHAANLADPDKRYLIAEEDSDRLLGYVILAGLANGNRGVELTRIVAAEPGRGHGRAIMAAAMDLIFGDLGAHRLWLDVFPENARARHLYGSLGFVEEGVLRDAVRADGAYRSLVIMSMLAPEHRRRRAQGGAR